LLADQTLPSTSTRNPSGAHFTPSIMQSEKSVGLPSLLSGVTSNA
jgi:hypothetical protein